MLPHAGNFRELVVYCKARALAQEIFRLTAKFPKEEAFSLTSQIRRASRSIGANLAEAWAKRRYEAHFVSKLTDADMEQYETQHWVETAVDCQYWDSTTRDALLKKCEEIGRLLNGMIDKAPAFCNPMPKALRETATDDYFTSDTDTL